PGPQEAAGEAHGGGGVDEGQALQAVREAGRPALEAGVEERRRGPLRRLARSEEREGAHVQDLAAARFRERPQGQAGGELARAIGVEGLWRVGFGERAPGGRGSVLEAGPDLDEAPAARLA